MHGQQNDKYTEMHGQQNVKKKLAICFNPKCLSPKENHKKNAKGTHWIIVFLKRLTYKTLCFHY
jgi:hypothetical protein